MTHEEFDALSEADQEVVMLGYSTSHSEVLWTTPIMTEDEDEVLYHWCDKSFFYDHYTGTYWTQVWKEEAEGPLVFGPIDPPVQGPKEPPFFGPIDPYCPEDIYF